MRLTTESMINDIMVLRSHGKTVCGIEMGKIAWDGLKAFLNNAREQEQRERAKQGFPHSLNFKKPIPDSGNFLLGVPLTVVTSLGKSINYLISSKVVEANPLWISREEILGEVADENNQKKS